MTDLSSKLLPHSAFSKAARDLFLQRSQELQALVEHHYRVKSAAPKTSFEMAGRLFASRTGWLMLSVPNNIVRGIYTAIQVPGIELPVSSTTGLLDAHISVMRPEELQMIGGLDAISERGHQLHYTLGPLQSVRPAGWAEMDRVWFVQVTSPELEKLRCSYGLSPLPNRNKYQFHITVAVRRRGVTQPNDIVKNTAQKDLDNDQSGMGTKLVQDSSNGLRSLRPFPLG